MGPSRTLLTFTACSSLLLLACGQAPAADEAGDPEHSSFGAGKADGGLDAESDEAAAVLLLVNDPAVDFAELDDDARLNRRAAENIIAHRDGDDATAGTGDDNLYDDLAELDRISYVGPSALGQLLDYAIANGYLARVQGDDDDGGADGDAMADVIFSPQPSDATHNARVAQLIGTAERSIDIAIYSFSNAAVRDALEEAAANGIKIRFIFETANADKNLEGAALLNSASGRLEAAGIDVRYVNKIMHHKYLIIDGPRDDLAAASSATIATGSANWSNSAGTRYDENTLFLRGDAELSLRMQREFNHLWNHSRDFVADPDFVFEASSVEISDANIADGPDLHAYFTSDNFDVTGTTFRVTGRNTVSDQLIAAIEGAQTSIHIASGHLRHRGISEALIARAEADPQLDIRVYLDAQEYVSAGTHAIQLEDLDDCLEGANTASQERGCMDRGFRFGYQLGESGAQVRYKWYAQRWHYTYAEQMHQKYMIIDGDELWTGSFNLSDNAEHNTFENMLVFRGAAYAQLVAAYEANFASMWETRRDDGTLGALRETIETADVIPLTFPAMALEHAEVDALKDLVIEHCPDVNSTDFRRHPESHTVCVR